METVSVFLFSGVTLLICGKKGVVREVDVGRSGLMSKIKCDNCDCWVPREDMWQCPECKDWICLEDDSDFDGWPGCMTHDGENGSVCGDCCIGYDSGYVGNCSTCALEYCDDCDEMWEDCECDDDDEDDD